VPGRAVGRGVFDGDRQGAGHRQAHREDEGGLAAGRRLRHVVDRDGRVVVADRAGRPGGADRGVGTLARLRKNTSSGSITLSPLTGTVMVLLVSPGLKVRVPLAGW